MTRKELIAFANEQYENRLPWCKREIRINNCTAWIVEWDFTDFKLLKSYSTIVGIYSVCTDTLYIFDYYSATTYQHIYKCAKKLDCMRITFLYHKSDNIIEKAMSEYANTIKLTNKQFRNLEQFDYSCYIETKAFR